MYIGGYYEEPEQFILLAPGCCFSVWVVADCDPDRWLLNAGPPVSQSVSSV